MPIHLKRKKQKDSKINLGVGDPCRSSRAAPLFFFLRFIFRKADLFTLLFFCIFFILINNNKWSPLSA